MPAASAILVRVLVEESGADALDDRQAARGVTRVGTAEPLGRVLLDTRVNRKQFLDSICEY